MHKKMHNCCGIVIRYKNQVAQYNFYNGYYSYIAKSCLYHFLFILLVLRTYKHHNYQKVF